MRRMPLGTGRVMGNPWVVECDVHPPYFQWLKESRGFLGSGREVGVWVWGVRRGDLVYHPALLMVG